jgi:hypothetical protein
MGKTYDEMQEEVKAGTPGDQAYWALYRQNAAGVWERIRHAEGNQISYEAQTAERNYVDQRQPSTEVTGYRKSLEKNIVVEKGDADYEFFNDWQIHEYKGRDALLDLLEVDLMRSERVSGTLWHIARKTRMTVTVTSLDATAGTLSVSFTRHGDTERGIAACLSPDPDEPTFKGDREITPVMAAFRPDSLALAVGETRAIPVVFASFGTGKDQFVVSAPSASAGEIKAERVRDSVVVTALAPTSAEVAVTVSSSRLGDVKRTIMVEAIEASEK